jgi:energy-coupling factor transporter ATP-binding protein EcfA2
VLKRIELKNFMSHAHTVIEPAAGLTVLVGPNNCGKSAVVTALQILCHNDSSTYVMRHGERECCVEVETLDGHVVRWTRKSSPSYLIDGQLFDRLRGAGLPEPLLQVLRLPEVDGGEGTTFDVHFGCQKSPIFLLDKPATAAAKFFASSSDAIRLVEMQRRHREKHAEKQREKTRLETESKQLNAELDALQPAAGLDHRLKTCEELHAELAILAGAIAQLEGEACKLEGQLTAVSYHQAETGAFAGLTAPPVLEPTAPIETLRERLEYAQSEVELTAGQAAILNRVESLPAMHDTAALADAIENVGKLALVVRRSNEEDRTLKSLLPLPVLEDTAHLEAMVLRIAQIAKSVRVETARQQALACFVQPPEPQDEVGLAMLLAALIAVQRDERHAAAIVNAGRSVAPPIPPTATEPWEKLVGDLRTAVERAKELELELQRITQEHVDIVMAIRELVATSVCPTCGAPLDADRLLAGAAAGGHAHE